jgi:glycosyltransferase involved in cell wall biosynthesis
MLNREPLVSVVTPFYNTREYLTECIESVLGQTYENWEYVLLDNQSTDGSSEIAAHYAERFPNKIRLIRTGSFLPQVQNYNFALTCISPGGKYCKMVQADDWIFPDCVRRMVEIAESDSSVGIVSAYELEDDEIRLDGLPYKSCMVSGPDACRLYFLRHRYLFGTPTSVLYRSEMIRSREPFFDAKYSPFEDGHACFDLLRIWNFGFVHEVLTYSRRGNNSIIDRARDFGLEIFLKFSLLAVHGRDYLDADEYAQCFHEAERQYFLFLGKAACARRRRGSDFWEFHRRGLKSVGYTLDWKLLAPWIPRSFYEKVLQAALN